MRPGSGGQYLVGVGVVLLGASAWAYLGRDFRGVPGQLVADEPLIEWRPSATNLSGSKVQPSIRFTLANPGRTPVRILSVESGCGCATPIVETETVVPGGTGAVVVGASPPASGERTVEFRVHTDSPSTPVVGLTLRMFGGEAPPFLLSAAGDLTYLDGGEGEARELTVWTIEREDGDRKTPAVKCDLDFLRFKPIGREVSPYYGPNEVQCKSTFAVELVASPPEGTTTGEVIVVDPWDDRRGQRVTMHSKSSLRVLPANPTLSLANVADQTARVEFVALSADEAGAVEVEPEDADGPLLVERRSGTGGRVAAFSARVKPGRTVGPGGHRLVAKQGGAKPSRVVVPITVVIEGGRP